MSLHISSAFTSRRTHRRRAIQAGQRDNAAPHFAKHPVIRVLQSSTSRWEHLEFDMDCRELACFRGHSFRSLVFLYLLGIRSLSQLGRELDIFQSAPKLWTFLSSPPHLPLYSMALPYENIPVAAMNVEVSLHSVNRLRRMIIVQALLLELSTSPHSRHIPLPNENDICLPHLRRLSLTFGGLRPREPGQLIGFLDRIRAPLSRLDMTFDSGMFVPELISHDTRSHG